MNITDLTNKPKEKLFFKPKESLSKSHGKFEAYEGYVDIDQIQSIVKLSDDLYAIATTQWDTNRLQFWIFKGETNIFD